MKQRIPVWRKDQKLKRLSDLNEAKVCKDCGQEIEYLADFPGPRCLSCHAKKFDREVALTGRLPKPNFVKAINR